MVLCGVVPECHRSVSGMVSECIMSAKMVSLSASGTVCRAVLVVVFTALVACWTGEARDRPTTVSAGRSISA